MSDSIKKHKRQNNMCNDENRLSLKIPEKTIGPYDIEQFIKEGSSSQIFLAKSKYTGENAIIKVLNKSKLENNLDYLLLIKKQIEILKILKHRNIVSLYEIYESPKYFYLITEHLSGKDLIEKLIRKKRFTEEEALRIFFQLLDAMTYMHKMNICHRNIRTEHILFDKNNRPKIIGFGYSTFYEKNKKIKGAYGSLCYACPEIIDDSEYNPELADVWSLGVILYVLICGYLPFSDEDDNRNQILIQNAKIDFPKETSNKLKDLIRHMLDKDPSKRYNFQKIAKHPWIKPYTESLFSGGLNVYINIFPVDERLLNIINQYGFDKEKIKNDLIQNKFNIGTGVYKQIIRKLLDLKMKNISDLNSDEFINYKNDEKNKYKDGEKKYEEYIKKVDENYKKLEDCINDFKERENTVVEKLLSLKEKKEKELELVEEREDMSEEEDDEEEEKDTINEIKSIENTKNSNDIIRRVQSHKIKSFNRTKTPNYNFRELMGRRGNNLNNNLLGNNINMDNVEIVYNKEEEVDIIQQFHEEQNKKISENINNLNEENKSNNEENLFMRKNSSATNLMISQDSNSNISNIKKSLVLFSPKTKKKKKLIKDLNKSQLNIKTKNEIFSKNDFNSNNFKNIFSGKIDDKSKGLLRMTSGTKSKKHYLDRSSFLDTFLKKNHPDNIRKTMSKLGNIYDFEEIKEGIKENDESGNENQDDDFEKNENEKELKKSLKYSLNFDDDEDEDENDENNTININRNSIGDSKLFEMLENGENDEELKELKKIYFNEEEKGEQEDKDKEIKENKNKEIKTSKFKDKKEPKSNNKKKVSFNLDNEYSNLKVTDLDKKEIKNNENNNDIYIVENIEQTPGRMRIYSQSEIGLQDALDGKRRSNLYEIYTSYINDKRTVPKLELVQFNKKEGKPLHISDIHNILKNKYVYSFTKSKNIRKLKLNKINLQTITDINNKVMKKKNKEKQKDINNEKEIPYKESKNIMVSSNNLKKKVITKKTSPIKMDQSTQTKNNEDLLNNKYLLKIRKEKQLKQIIKSLKTVNEISFYIKALYNRPDFNYFYGRKFYDNNYDNNIYEKENEIELNNSITFNPYSTNNSNDLINRNYNPSKNYYKNIPNDKNKKLSLTKRQKKLSQKRINNSISFNPKNINNFIGNKSSLNKYYKDDFESFDDIKINNTQIRNDYLNSINNKTLEVKNDDKLNPFSNNKDINDNKFLLDKISLSDLLNKSKDIRNEFITQRKELLDNIQQCNDILKTANYDKKNLKDIYKTNSKYGNNEKYQNNYIDSYISNKPKNNYSDISKKVKNVRIHNNSDINHIDKDININLFNYQTNKNKLGNNLINKQNIQPRDINILNKEKSNQNNYTNKIKDKDKLSGQYNINSFPEKYNDNKFKKNKYSSMTEKNDDILNIKKNNYINQNDNFDNYSLEDIYSSINKKKAGLYKNNEKYNYLSNNKEKPMVNLSLKNYMEKFKDIDLD